MIRAKHLMNQSTPVLFFDAKVNEAIDLMQKQQAGFIAIKAGGERFQGVLTEGALARIYLRYRQHPEKDSLILYRDLFEPLQLIHEDEIFDEVVKKVLTAVGHRVFVINGRSEVLGYLTAKNILPTLKGEAQVPSTAPSESFQSHLYLYESFFEKSPFMMHSVDRDGVIQMANEMLHSVLGYEFGELIGRTIFDLYVKGEQKSAKAGIQEIFQKGYHEVVRSNMRTKTGGSIEVELVSKALTNQAHAPIGTITVSRPLKMELLLKALPQI